MNARDHFFLQRCIQLARLAAGSHFPNPQVGAVIVHEGRIIGEGYHQRAGEAHAEVNAVNRVKDKSCLTQSTIYVSLEPCNHTGKTPPCVDLILHHQIPRVVIGCLDPNPEVAGKGVARLRAKGVEVQVCPDPEPYENLIRWFRVNQEQNRPWLTLKWAQSTDGYMGRYDEKGRPRPENITGFEAGIFTHRLRARHQAILVGRRTAEADNPRLSTRLYPGPSPLRLLLDPEGRLSDNLRVFHDGGPVVRLSRRGDGPHSWQLPPQPDWETILVWLYQEKGICSLLVEGGAKTLRGLLAAGLGDEILRYTSPLRLTEGVKAPRLPEGVSTFRQFFAGKDRIELLNWV